MVGSVASYSSINYYTPSFLDPPPVRTHVSSCNRLEVKNDMKRERRQQIDSSRRRYGIEMSVCLLTHPAISANDVSFSLSLFLPPPPGLLLFDSSYSPTTSTSILVVEVVAAVDCNQEHSLKTNILSKDLSTIHCRHFSYHKMIALLYVLVYRTMWEWTVVDMYLGIDFALYHRWCLTIKCVSKIRW